jgi:hypothetical protein
VIEKEIKQQIKILQTKVFKINNNNNNSQKYLK